jgi:hypothetical protein
MHRQNGNPTASLVRSFEVETLWEGNMKVSKQSKRKIVRQVNQLFAKARPRYGDSCTNPVTGAGYIQGEDPKPQKKAARLILLQIEHFAINGPADAQPLRPVLWGKSKELKEERFVLDYIVGRYARSLEGHDPDEHPSFADYASGLLWQAEHENIGVIEDGDQFEALKKRFPPRELAGMGADFYWRPPKEHAEYQESLRRARARKLALAQELDHGVIA